MVNETRTNRQVEFFTLFIGVFTLVAAGAGVFARGFYTGIVDPVYATGNITADVISLVSIPIIAVCVKLARRDNVIARLVWVALTIYLGYVYANYAFDRTYTIFFLVYVAIFGLSCVVSVSLLASLEIGRIAIVAQNMPFRRLTSGFLLFTGFVLYAIELPILIGRIPGGTQSGGTPFMVLDMALVAPFSILTGIWLWQQKPWGSVLCGIFLIKAITLMSGFLIADYIDWFAGRLEEPAATIAFSLVFLLVCFFTWNYYSALNKLTGK